MSFSQSGDLFSRSTRDAAIDELHAATALYTQDPIVVQLLDQIAWPAGHGALLDTSCGDGAFLGRALERLLETHADVSDAELCARLEGWEIHFFAASEARTRLRRVLIDHGRDASSADALASQMIRCGDFLTEGPRRGHYQAVVGDPPYWCATASTRPNKTCSRIDLAAALWTETRLLPALHRTILRF